MDFDSVSEQLGEFGKYQQIIYLLICLPPIFVSMHTLSSVFTAATPNYRCFIEGCDNANTSYLEPWLNSTIPFVTVDDFSRPSHCLMFQHNSSIEKNSCFSEEFNQHDLVKCHTWKFDSSVYKSTVVTEWNLTCQNSWLTPLSGTMWMLGVIIGAIIYGDISDRYGRRRALLIGFLIFSLTSLLQPYSVNYMMYLFIRCIQASSASGIYQTVFVLGLEFVGKSKRVFCGIFFNISFAFGEIVLGILAYFIRDWTVLQFYMGFPTLIFLSYYWFMPESIRWLLAKKKFFEAKKIIRKAAKINNVVISPALMNFERLSDSDEYEIERLSGKRHLSRSSAFQLLTNKKLRWRSLNIFLNWFMNTVGYYGISMNSTNLGGNEYVNFLLTSFIEIPAYIFCILVLDRFGRRPPLVSCMVVGGLACLSTIFVPNKEEYAWISMALSLVGKFGTAAAFGIIYVFSAELFPTVLRNNGIGISSFFAHLGGMIAPYIASLATIHKSLPLIIFGSSLFSSGVLAMCLPETLGEELPETITDAENLGIFQDESKALLCENNSDEIVNSTT